MSADADAYMLLQFHPTGFFQGSQVQGQTFLISEAVRGEGGLLYNLDGKRFMTKYDDRLELAPRDVVARSIHDQVDFRASFAPMCYDSVWNGSHASGWLVLIVKACLRSLHGSLLSSSICNSGAEQARFRVV